MTIRSRFFIISLLLLPLLSGCATIDIRGHEVDPELLAKIEIGVTTKEQVGKLLGTPSSVSPLERAPGIICSKKPKGAPFWPPQF